MEVKTLKISGQKLYMSLDVSKETIKVEVSLDGHVLDQVVRHAFDEVVMDLGNVQSGNHAVIICAYDRFLNCNEQKLTISN